MPNPPSVIPFPVRRVEEDGPPSSGDPTPEILYREVRLPPSEWGTLYAEDYEDVECELRRIVHRFGPFDPPTYHRIRERLIYELRVYLAYIQAPCGRGTRRRREERAITAAAAALNLSYDQVKEVVRIHHQAGFYGCRRDEDADA
jgi:hypothetical protein